MTVSTISVVGGQSSGSHGWRLAANTLLRRCRAAAILLTLTAFSSLVVACLISVFAHGEKFVGEIDDILIALVFCGVAAALKIIEKGLRARSDRRRLSTVHCFSNTAPPIGE